MLAGGEEGADGGDADNAGGTSQRARHGQSDSIHNGGDAANTPLHGPTVETVDNVDTFDVESWVASLRPSADYLNAGAAFVGSDELRAHKRCCAVLVNSVPARCSVRRRVHVLALMPPPTRRGSTPQRTPSSLAP